MVCTYFIPSVQPPVLTGATGKSEIGSSLLQQIQGTAAAARGATLSPFTVAAGYCGRAIKRPFAPQPSSLGSVQ